VTASFTCPVDSGAVMSKQQQHAAALTYAKRQSLVQALGLTTTDPDTDGAGDSAEAITEDQQTELADLLQQSKADMRKFLSWLGVEKLSEIPARDYTRAKEALARKRGKA
jgi:hypothetical protein